MASAGGGGAVAKTLLRWRGSGIPAKDAPRAAGRKDRQGEVRTTGDIRDLRIQLSVPAAIIFYNVQDLLGYDQPSKTVEWLIDAASESISQLSSLKSSFSGAAEQLSDKNKSVSVGEDESRPESFHLDLNNDPNSPDCPNPDQQWCISCSESACSTCLPLQKSSLTIPEETSRGESALLRLEFVNKLPANIFTGSWLVDEENNPIKLRLLNERTHKIVSAHPLSSERIEIVVLDGDFGCHEPEEDWTEQDFSACIIRETEGRRPLLTGELSVTLREGVACLGGIAFTDNSSWTRSPLKKGPWSVEEDTKLTNYIKRYGIWNWSRMPKAAGLKRSGKSCRLRWMNYLRPNIRRGKFSEDEQRVIIKLHQQLGNRWQAIAASLPGRTDNEIKNFWNTHLKKRVLQTEKLMNPQVRLSHFAGRRTLKIKKCLGDNADPMLDGCSKGIDIEPIPLEVQLQSDLDNPRKKLTHVTQTLTAKMEWRHEQGKNTKNSQYLKASRRIFILRWRPCRAVHLLLQMRDTIAKEIVRACARDSRSLTLMARALRNVSDTEIWEYALDSLSLQHASCRDDYENLSVNVLKFCIELLDDDVTRNCLKSLAMQSKSKEVGRASMLDSWIGDGMLVTRSEGEIIVKNLLDAKLLELSENGELVKFVDIGQHLVHLALHPEEGSELLMQGGLGLVEPTEVEEWERTKEICLMHNNLTEFPENPRCPSLLPLFLQRNHKLRVIPSLFFRHMPALEVLNLSRTHIKSLPDSLFQLVSLQRLFLNECILLRTLSAKVGGLRNLEVLDLKGTKLMGLPKEIEQLVNLTCLEVSILSTSCKLSEEPHPLIPSRVLLSLSQLEELNIDVGPDAERWDSCMEVLVDGICSLGRLNTLKFYFTKVELMRQFDPTSLSHFRIIIGKHIGCIMSRLPPDIEFKLECWDRYLKYIHGKGILQDVMKVLRKADAFFLDRHTDLKKLSDFGKENLEYLRCCVLGECNELQVLNDGEDFGEQGDRICLGSLKYLYVYYVKNLEAIWRGPVQKGSLSCLKSLTLRTCPKITSIFTRELLENLCNLEELTLEDCPALVSLVSCKRCSLRNILLPAQVEEDEASLPAAIDEHL
ncbi:hypothetical protein CRG98_004673 [Punica granatum]|uniref:Uncharacterized protein n=1 Tax=Punica granatum TaxID=22663 RepID=A0A2I0L2G5_PUNGR|nr:hypothetical protein CRG98_004673 [Punica granatum]